MIKLGITGGIGSGKSTVSRLFELSGVPVYNADKETKTLNDTSPVIREKLMHHFGAGIYDNEVLNKKKFADIIFNDADKLQLANSIIHPEVLKHFNQWCSQHSNHSIVALEAAILFESNFHIHLDKIITVYTSLNRRVARVALRDNVDEESVRNRIKHQMPEKEKISLSDYVIMNNEESSLIEQVNNLLNEITHTSIKD